VEIEKTLSSVWDQHLGAEFAAKDADQAVATMTSDSYVNVVPLMIGARGRDRVRDFYASHFLSQLPPGIETVPVSRTIGQGQVVDELIIRFTHSVHMDWLLPGVPPTGKHVEMPLVVIIKFEATRSRTSTSTGTRLRCSSSSAFSIERFPFAAARSPSRC